MITKVEVSKKNDVEVKLICAVCLSVTMITKISCGLLFIKKFLHFVTL